MAQPLFDQYQTTKNAWLQGDFDLFQKVLVSPDAVTPEDTLSFAEQLGLKNSLLSAAVNIVSDPLVIGAFFLQRRFPTSQYIRGVIPKRFIGAANEFTGLSAIGRTTVGFFRGTHVPPLTSLIMKREADVMQVGNKIFDQLIGRPNWVEEMPIVSSLLEGQRPVGATPELKNLALEIRGHMNELWRFIGGTQKISGGVLDGPAVTRATAGEFAPSEAPKFLRDFLPHIPLMEEQSSLIVSGRDAISRMGRSRLGQVLQLSGQNPANIWKPIQGDRLSSTYPDFQRFMANGGAATFNPRLFKRQRFGLTTASTDAEGGDLFVTDLNVILQKYILGVARTHALNTPLSATEQALASTLVEGPGGVATRINASAAPPIVQIINQGLDAAGPSRLIREKVAGTNTFIDRVDTSKLNGPTLSALKTLVRDVTGRAGPDEILMGNMFSAIRNKVRTAFNPGQQNQLNTAISALERDGTDRRVMSGITSWFYSSTLGLNPASALKNLFQPFLTTIPAIGLGPTIEGYKVLQTRLPQYASTFIRERKALSQVSSLRLVDTFNVAQERAFTQTFPELAATGIKADPRLFELKDAELLNRRGVFKNSDAYHKFLLQPFTQTEMSNQIVSFYGGKTALTRAIQRGELEVPVVDGAKLTGKGLDDFLNFESSNIVNATQFRPGPGSRSILQSVIPAPLRMFSSFPTRLGNYFSESLVRGALTQEQLNQSGALTKLTGGRNLGTVARTLIAGRIITEGFRGGLGIDMSDAVGLTGPFTNVLSQGNAFTFLPIAPLPGVLSSIARFTSTRDIRDLQPLTLPVVGDVPVPRTLIPAGVAITRATRAFQAFRPDLGGFVDQDERLMLQGGTGDLLLSMLGIPLEKERRLREQLDRMNANRLRIRGLRRQYAVAFNTTDTGRMQEIEQQYTKEFPNMGPFNVSRDSLRRYNEFAHLTSAQRVIRSMGRKGAFMEGTLLRIDPDLVATPEEQQQVLTGGS